jgi:hypothetical protein
VPNCRFQSIGHDAPGLVLQASQQALEEALGCGGISPVLHEKIEHHAVLVDRAPEVVQLALDLQEHFTEVPGVARPRPPLAEPASKSGTEPEAPLPDALMTDNDTPLGQDQLHVAQAQAEKVVQPHGMADDLGRETVAGVGGGLWRHRASLDQPPRPGQKPRT